MRKVTKLIGAMTLVLTVAGGCEDSAGPSSDLDVEEVTLLALETDGLTGLMVDDLMVGLGIIGLDPSGVGPRQGSGPFTRTRDCPAGGTITVSGTVERTANEGVVEWNVEGNGTWANCARTRRELTLTINGQFEFESHRKHVNGAPEGPQTSSKSGSYTWTRSDGKSGTCEFSVTSTRDPEAGTRTVKGTVCGREIDRTVEWTRRG